MSFEIIRRGALEYLISTEIETPHCFSTRCGGVSEGYLSSLNLGIHCGDKPENCRKNYEILGNAVGFRPEDTVFFHQVHSDIVRRVGKIDRGCGFDEARQSAPCDGLLTNDPDVALTVFGADCTTVLLHDPKRRAAAAVHAGWRGTAAGIVKNAVEALQREFGADPADIRAAIGPCIGRCCFETHREVPDAMLAALGVDALPAIDVLGMREDGEKFSVDLKLLNAIWLRRAGVDRIDVCPDCTACQPDHFWSHRRTGGHRGSQAAIIVLK